MKNLLIVIAAAATCSVIIILTQNATKIDGKITIQDSIAQPLMGGNSGTIQALSSLTLGSTYTMSSRTDFTVYCACCNSEIFQNCNKIK